MPYFMNIFGKNYSPDDELLLCFSPPNIVKNNIFLKWMGDNLNVMEQDASFMNEIDQLCLKYNILPSVIKDSRLPKLIFEKTYKFANVFRENLYKFDKKRVYKSEVSRRLGI